MTVSILSVWVTDGEEKKKKKIPNGMFYKFRESYSVNHLLKSLNCTDSTGGWVISWTKKVVDMHEASGDWEGCVCVHVWALIQVCDGSMQVGSPAVCNTIEQWDTKLVETRKCINATRTPERGLGDKQEEDEQSCSLAPNSSRVYM